LDIDAAKVKLTDLASCGGCAAKYSAARLEQLLAGFVPAEAENLLVGLAPADVLRKLQVNAVTDVTGFGLFGHAYEMADRSGVRIALESERFPAIDGALDLARSGVRTSGDPRNRDFAGRHLTLNGVPETLVALGYDPQTAGGLLVTLPAEQGAALEAEFGAQKLFVRRIGRVEAGAGVDIS
jgi:selenide,water dikinase